MTIELTGIFMILLQILTFMYITKQKNRKEIKDERLIEKSDHLAEIKTEKSEHMAEIRIVKDKQEEIEKNYLSRFEQTNRNINEKHL